MDKEKILKQIALNIKLQRVRKNLAQEQLAEMSNLHTNFIGKIERSQSNPTIISLFQIAEALSISIDELLKFE